MYSSLLVLLLCSFPSGTGADLHAANAARMADLGPRAHACALALDARSGSQALQLSLDSRGRAAVLSGSDLASQRAYFDACGVAGAPWTEAWYAAVLRGFLAENTPLFLGEKGRMDPLELRLERVVAGPLDGEVYVELRQERDGLTVEHGDVRAQFIEGRLVCVSGAPADTSAARKTRALSEADLRRAAKTAGARSLGSTELIFDAERLAPVFLVREDPHTDPDARVLRFDAETGALLGEQSLGLHFGEETHDIWRLDYPDAPNYFQNGQWVLEPGQVWTEQPTTLASPLCPTRYEPHRAPGTPDRVGAMFTQDQPGDPVWDVGVTGTCLSNPLVAWGPSNYLSATLNASYWLDRMADLFQHPFSYFYYPHTSSPLTVYVKNHNLGGAGVYWSGLKAIGFEQGPSLPNGATGLGTIAHEYGHYIHDTYGLRGNEDVIEGWADHTIHRLAAHMRFDTFEWAGLDYLDWGLRHGHKVVNGEFVIDAYPDGGDKNYYWPGEDCDPAAWNPYGCGAVQSIVYWELVHDRARMSYGGVVQGEDLIQSGPYANGAQHLVNSAYAYAISMVSSGNDTSDLIDLVAARYAQFQSIYGFLSPADLDRVYDVMAHHCLGPAQKCTGGWHLLAGSRLPSSETHKQLFYEAEDFEKSPVPPTMVKAFNKASGGAYARLGSASQASYTMAAPAGEHRLKLLLRVPVSGSVEVNLGGKYWISVVTDAPISSWTWVDGPMVSLSSPGKLKISVRTGGKYASLDLDALTLSSE